MPNPAYRLERLAASNHQFLTWEAVREVDRLCTACRDMQFHSGVVPPICPRLRLTYDNYYTTERLKLLDKVESKLRLFDKEAQ
jgi:hypothetical protein